MKKVIGSMSKFIFGAFGLAVLILLASLTYGALQKLFPGNFMNQMWGLVLFDVGAMCWALAFVYQSRSTAQYATSALGFIVSLVGTLLMVAFEVVSSGQTIADLDAQTLGLWVVYGFIIATALHTILIYAHHGSAPEIHEQISVGIARGEVVTKAIEDATHTIEAEKHELSRAIYNDIVSQVKRDLGLHPVDGTVFDRRQPRTYELTAPAPSLDEDNGPISDDLKRSYAPGTHFRDGTITPTDLNDPFWSEHPHHMTERWGNQEAGPKPSPFPVQPPE
jgi:hypothetical protein